MLIKLLILAVLSYNKYQNPLEINEIEKAIQQQNYASISSIAHKMKTSVGFIGIDQLLAPLNKLEKSAIAQGNTNDINLLFEEIKTTCNKAIIELSSFLKEIEV